MTDGDLLRAAILDQPAEDTPRLAYADWLDEQAKEVECPKCTAGKLYDGWAVWRCKVCMAEPDDDGRVEHGKGCYTQDEDGGGSSYVEVTDCDCTGRVPDGNAERAELLRLPGWYEISAPDSCARTGWRLYWCVPGREAAVLGDHPRPSKCPLSTCGSGWQIQVFLFGSWMCFPCAAKEATNRAKSVNILDRNASNEAGRWVLVTPTAPEHTNP